MINIDRLQISGSEPEKSGDVVSKTRDDQVMLNAGGDNDAYQTVTIVPSDTNSGEVTPWITRKYLKQLITN